MSDLNAFRNETRDWLEANCPESMRTPMSQGDVVWGGRKVEFKDPDQKLWMDRMGEKDGLALLGQRNMEVVD